MMVGAVLIAIAWVVNAYSGSLAMLYLGAVVGGLGAAAIGRLADRAHHPLHDALLVQHRAGAGLEPAILPARHDAAILDAEGLARARERRLVRVADAVAVGRP